MNKILVLIIATKFIYIYIKVKISHAWRRRVDNYTPLFEYQLSFTNRNFFNLWIASIVDKILQNCIEDIATYYLFLRQKDMRYFISKDDYCRDSSRVKIGEEQKGKSIEGLKKRARRKVARARAATQGAQGGYYQTV